MARNQERIRGQGQGNRRLKKETSEEIKEVERKQERNEVNRKHQKA